MSLLWRIYYDDAVKRDHGIETWSNEDGAWEDAPVHGVVCMVVRDTTGAVGRYVFYSGWKPLQKRTDYRHCPHCDGDLPSIGGAAGNNDFFVKPPDAEPYSTPDLIPFLERKDTDESMVKYGRMVGNDEWQRISALAVCDKDFPVSTPRRRATDP